MAGSFNNNGVWWNTGDTAGRNDAGSTASLPNRVVSINGSGTAAPTATPTTGSPIYFDTDTNDAIYVWVGTAWKGPYKTSA